MQLPAVMNPSAGASTSNTEYMWCGDSQLAPIWGSPESTASGAQLNVRAKIAKMMDCPSVNHPYIDPASVTSNTPWEFDYQYNQNLGQWATLVAGSNAVATWKTNGATGSQLVYAKRTRIRNQTLVAMDDRDESTNHDYVFNKVATLVPPIPGGPSPAGGGTGDGKGQAGTPHNKGKMANMLFQDGQIILADPNQLITSAGNLEWILDWHVSTTGSSPFN